jgi:hypothetical protein
MRASRLKGGSFERAKKTCVTLSMLRTPASEMAQGDVDHRRKHVKPVEAARAPCAHDASCVRARFKKSPLLLPGPPSGRSRTTYGRPEDFMRYRRDSIVNVASDARRSHCMSCASAGTPRKSRRQAGSARRGRDFVHLRRARLRAPRANRVHLRFAFSSASIVFGQSSLSSLESERSASTRPPVWQRGQ